MENTAKPGPDSACDICGSAETQGLYVAYDRLASDQQAFTIAKCLGCGVLRTFPEMSDSDLSQFYPNDYWGEEPSEEWIKKSQAEKTAFLAKCASAGQILDVGCGSGYFLRALDEQKWDRFGVEIGREAVSAARMHLGEDHIVEGSLVGSGFDNENFDVITFWSALEHMNHPSSALAEVHRILRSSGKLILQVPNGGSYQASWFKGSWFALDAPRHRYHFSKPVLERCLNDNGFAIERITFVSREHNAHALRQSLKSTFSRVPYLLIKPLTTPVDHLLSTLGRGATITLAAHKI